MRNRLVAVFRVALVIFLIEGAVMLVLPHLGLSPQGLADAFVAATALTFDGGVCVYFLVVRPYVAARDKSERQLHESEQQFRDLIEGSRQGIVIHRDFKPLFVNQAFADFFGIASADEILALDDILSLHPEHERIRLRGYAEARRAGQEVVRNNELEALHRDGSTLWFDVQARAIEWYGQSAIQATFTDITERKLAADALRESEALYTTILDNIPTPISLKSVDGRYLFVNKIFAERRGLPVDEIKGKSAFDLLPKEIAGHLEAEDAELLDTRAVVESEIESLDTDGVQRLYQGVKFPVFGADGEIIATGSVHNDITRQKQNETEAARQTAVVTALIDNLPAHISMRDPEGKFVFVNRTMAQAYGHDKSAFVGRRLDEIDRSADGSGFQKLCEEVQRGGAPIGNLEFDTALFPDRTFLINVMPMRGADGAVDGVLAISLDITDRKQAEEALKASEARFAGILDIAPDAIITTDEDGNVRMFNQGARDTFGYREDEVLGRSMAMLMPERFRLGHARQMARFGASGEQSRRMSERSGIVGLRKDGTEFAAEATVSTLELGKERLFNVILRDITERKRIEREINKARETAEAANNAKSEFLANMSHELRTPLNAILGFSEIMAEERFGSLGSAKYKEYAADIHTSGTLLLDLISDVLDLSRIESGALDLAEDAVEVNQVLDAALRMIEERAARKSLRIETDFDPASPVIRGDERAIKQIMLNLLSNCTKFTREGGAITVSSKIEPDGGISLTVADTGIGIAAADIPKVLEPFGQIASAHTREHEGTGLGLPFTKSLTELHDATFELESEIGVGTTVRLRFPPQRRLKAGGGTPAEPIPADRDKNPSA